MRGQKGQRGAADTALEAAWTSGFLTHPDPSAQHRAGHQPQPLATDEHTRHFAYADPPYLGCCEFYEHHHPDGRCWDDASTHQFLIDHLSQKYPDGWALSLSSTSLHTILPMCPPDVRIAAWVKPFAAFKRNVRNAYTWEPVILRGGRVSSKDGAPVTRDHLAEPITLQRGLTGAKPQRFNRWVLDMLGYIDGDQVDDLYPGTAGMAAVLAQGVLAVTA